MSARTKQKAKESTAKRALKYLNSEAGGISRASSQFPMVDNKVV